MPEKKTASAAKALPDIEIKCSIPGYEDCVILYKRAGWKFGHLRTYESPTVGADDLVVLFAERISDWKMKDEAGNDVPFVPNVKSKPDGKVVPNKALMDALHPSVASWVTASFRDAYLQSSIPFPS